MQYKLLIYSFNYISKSILFIMKYTNMLLSHHDNNNLNLEYWKKITNIKFIDYCKIVDMYKSNVILNWIAERYAVQLERVEHLAQDPDHGNKITVSSCIETMVALELEAEGILGIKVSRGEAKTDIIDGWKRKWDVKAPPKVPDISFSIDDAVNSIKKKFNEFPEQDIGIMLCISFLDLELYLKLQKSLIENLTPNERLRVRQIEINDISE